MKKNAWVRIFPFRDKGRTALAVCCAALLALPDSVLAQTAQPPQPPAAQKSPAQLDSLVAPVALYPDPLLSQVLVASTYPLEIVEAERWLRQNSGLQGQALVAAAAKQSWDASVQALTAFPDVLTKLDQHISWTTDLGNAFLAQEGDVMQAVQRMRQKAEESGKLQSTPQQTVTTGSSNNQTYIEIQPANPQVMYVPQYDPNAVWGAPAYYPYPDVGYSTGAIVASSVLSFGAGVAVGALFSGGGWGWGFGWGNNAVVVNNNFFNNNHFNRANVYNGNRWQHSPAHRGAVPYSNRAVADRFQQNRPNFQNRPNAGQVQQRLGQAGRQMGVGPFTGGRTFGQNAPGQGARPGAIGGANRPDLGGRGPGAIGGQNRPDLGNRPGGPGAVGGANRVGNMPNMNRPSMPAMPGGDRMGNRQIGGFGAPGRGAFGDMNMGGGRARMNSGRGFGSMGGGGFRGGGFRGGGRRR